VVLIVRGKRFFGVTVRAGHSFIRSKSNCPPVRFFFGHMCAKTMDLHSNCQVGGTERGEHATQLPWEILIWRPLNSIFNVLIRAGPIPILSIGYRPILQAFRYVPIPKNFQILLSEKYLNLIEQAASRKAPTLVFQENWLDNNLLTCYTYSGVFSGVWNLDACWLILIL
jgi:hypothetical protein